MVDKQLPAIPGSEIADDDIFGDLQIEEQLRRFNEDEGTGDVHGKVGRPQGEKQDVLPYEWRHRRAQRLMAMVIDPATNGVLTKTRVAELCSINRKHLWKWVHDERRGGKVAWYNAVEAYAREQLAE